MAMAYHASHPPQKRPRSAYLPDPAQVDTSGWITATAGYAGLYTPSETDPEAPRRPETRPAAATANSHNNNNNKNNNNNNYSYYINSNNANFDMQHFPTANRRPYTSGVSDRSDQPSPEVEVCSSVAMLDYQTYAESLRSLDLPVGPSSRARLGIGASHNGCDWGDWMNENDTLRYDPNPSLHPGKGPSGGGGGGGGGGSKFRRFWRRVSTGRGPAHDSDSDDQHYQYQQSQRRRAASLHHRSASHPYGGKNRQQQQHHHHRQQQQQQQTMGDHQWPLDVTESPLRRPTAPPALPTEQRRQPRRLVKKNRPASSPTLPSPLYEPTASTFVYDGIAAAALPLPPPSMAELPGSHRLQKTATGGGAGTGGVAGLALRADLSPDFYPLDTIGQELATARYKLGLCCDCGTSPVRGTQPTCDWCGETRRRVLEQAPSHTSSLSVFRPSSVYGTLSPYDNDGGDDDDDATTIHSQTASEVVEERKQIRVQKQLWPLQPMRGGHEQEYQPECQQEQQQERQQESQQQYRQDVQHAYQLQYQQAYQYQCQQEAQQEARHAYQYQYHNQRVHTPEHHQQAYQQDYRQQHQQLYTPGHHQQQYQQAYQQDYRHQIQPVYQAYRPEFQATKCPQCGGLKETMRQQLCNHCYTASLSRWAHHRW